MAERAVRVRLVADVNGYIEGVKRAGLATSDFGHQLSGHGTAAHRDMERVGRAALVMAGGVTVGLGLSAKAAMDWESAWTGVTKTVDGTASQMAELEAGLRNLTRELPATHAEIAGVAEAAGQLGIKRTAIIGFTRTMIDLSETTNLSADQAATSIAQMVNIMGTAQSDVDRLGSTLVALGNAGASTESQILEMGMRIAGAGRQVGLSEADVLGFANGLASMGIEAESGGSAISRTFATIASAVAGGGAELDKFAQIAGVTSQQFATRFQQDAAGATVAFIQGLDRISESGGNVFAVLESVGLSEIRVRDALLRASGASAQLAASLELGEDAWKANNALTTEAEKRYATTAAKVEVFRNTVSDAAINVGQKLLPALTGTVDGLSAVVMGFSSLEGAGGTAVAVLGSISAAGLGMIGVIGVIAPKWQQLMGSLKEMGSGGQFLARNLGKATLALGAVGVAVTAYSYVLGQNEQRKQRAIALADEYKDAILAETGALIDNIDAVTAKNLTDWGGSNQLRELDADFELLARGIRDGDDALVKLGDSFKNFNEAPGADSPYPTDEEFLKFLDSAGLKGSELGDELLRLRGQMTPEDFDALIVKLGDLDSGFTTGSEKAKTATAVLEGLGLSSKDAAALVGGLGGSVTGLAADMAAAATRTKELQDALSGTFDPFTSLRDALDAAESSQRAVTDAQREAEQAARDVSKAQAEVAEAMSITADMSKAAEDGIRGVIDAMRAQFDPLFGMLDALQSHNDAQDEATKATKRYGAASDAAKGANLDLAKSVVGVQTAAAGLVGAVRTGQVSLDGARQSLAEWVRQGLITEQQAAGIAGQFDSVVSRAEELQGKNIDIGISTSVDAARAEADRERTEKLAEAHQHVADAQLAAADAQRQVAEAQADGLDAALAINLAALELAGALGADADLLDRTKRRLKEWADQGLITAEQAADISEQLDILAGKALALTGANVDVHLNFSGKGFEEIIAMLGGDAVVQMELGSALAESGLAQRHGGVLAFAGGGMHQAHIANRQVVRYAESGTGGEAFVPRFGNTRRALDILSTAAGWYGATVSQGQAGPSVTVNQQLEGVSMMQQARSEQAARRVVHAVLTEIGAR